MLVAQCCLIAKFHYTGPTGPDGTGPDQTKSAHIVGDELNSTTRTRPDPTGPDRTHADPHGPERTGTDFVGDPHGPTEFLRDPGLVGPV